MGIASPLSNEHMLRKSHEVFAKMPRLDMEGLCWLDNILYDAHTVISD